MNTHTMTRSDFHRWALRRFPATAWLAAALFLSPVATADDPKSAAPPATAPVAPPPSPKAIALAFVAALDKGDAPAAKALLPADETHAKWVDAGIALSAALKKLDAAAATRFKEAGKIVSQNQLHFADSLKSLEQAQEKIEGDAATLTVPGQAQPLRLTRVAGKWQLLVGPTGPTAPKQLALYPRLTRAANLTAEEIAAGAHGTPEAAAKIFAARLLEARMGL